MYFTDKISSKETYFSEFVQYFEEGAVLVKWLLLLKNKIRALTVPCPRARINNDKESGRGGFVIFDALLGILLVSIAVVAIIWALTQNTKTLSYGNNYTKATYVAQAKLEELRERDGASTELQDGDALLAADTIVREGTTFNVTLERHTGTQTALNAALPEANKVVPVKVTVAWSEAGKAESITMHAYYYSK